MTELHKENMRKHIAFLEDNAEEIRKSFDMFNLFHKCGTPSCSLGYASISLGISIPVNTDEEIDSTNKMCVEQFGFKWFSKEWDYMFDYKWAKINNTPEAAAARMKAVLYNQVPTYWNFSPEFAHPIVIVPEELETILSKSVNLELIDRH